MRETIAVNLGARSYDIHVGPGLLGEAAALLAPLARGPVPVVTDSNVAALHLATLLGGGLEARPIVIEPGEASKSFQGLQHLVGELLATGLDRGGLLVALGGGVIGDLAGFAAGVFMRGVAYAQIPTTLLAQVDSSVGGKTAINTMQGKNLVGLFHQPSIVIADTELLKTLPRREVVAGYAEVVKYGALGDRAFFEWLETHGAAALAGDGAAMAQAVAQSCRMKAAIVSRDERESGERALLNLGHTFGHALEAATEYSERLLHGEGVAIGMVLAFRLSARLGLCPAAETDRLVAHLRKAGLPTSIADIAGARPQPGALIDLMRHDKKTKDGRIQFVLARGIGQAFVTDDVPMVALTDMLST